MPCVTKLSSNKMPSPSIEHSADRRAYASTGIYIV